MAHRIPRLMMRNIGVAEYVLITAAPMVRFRVSKTGFYSKWGSTTSLQIPRRILAPGLMITRLTNGLSKKDENLKAAVSLHFAYYNFMRLPRSLRVTLPWGWSF